MAYNWPAENLTVQEKVGVGTETPTEKLEVKGNLKLNTGVAIGEFSSDTTFATPTHQAVPTTQAVKTYVNAQVAAVTTALATKAEKGGSLTQNFQTDNLTVQGNLEVTGQTTFRNIEQHQGDLELGNEDTDQVKIHGKLLSTHSSGTLQVVSPLQVVGTITANKFVGDGSDLTGITQWVSGAGGTLFYNGGNVGIGLDTPQAKLDVKGAIRAGNSDIYFSETNHNHTGLGNPAGFAAIENASEYGALMILGRAGTAKGRYVRLWDYLQVNGGLDITGNVGIGTETPDRKLVVRGGETSLQQEDWQTPTFQSGWVNYGGVFNPAGYFKDSLGIIHLRGLVKNGSGTIFTLPAGYRPAGRELHAVATYPEEMGRIDVLTDGQVFMQKGSNAWISLDGITFRAGGRRVRVFDGIVDRGVFPVDRIVVNPG